MAILEGAPRSATAIAVETVKVLEFNRANFEILMMGNPQIALRITSYNVCYTKLLRISSTR